MFTLLLVAGVVFVVYAMYTQWNNTDETESLPKRVWAAIVMAVAAFGTAIADWFHMLPWGN